MITITRPIPNITHSGNPVLLYVNSDNIVETPGIKSQISIMLATTGTGLANNDTFVIEVMNAAYTFTAKTSPNDSGTEVRTRAGGDSDIQYMTKLAQDIAANYDLFTNYEILATSIGPDTFVVLTAKEAGDLYTLQSFTCGTSIFTATDIDGVDKTLRPNFKIMCQTWADNISSSELISEDRLSTDADGNAVFNLSALLRNKPQPSFTWPVLLPYNFQPIVFLYYTALAEVYGTPGTVKKVVRQATKYTLPGMLEQEYFEQRYRAYELYPSSLETLFITENDVLWNREFKTYCAPTDNEKIYFISSLAWTIKITVTYNDGTAPSTFDFGTWPFAPLQPIGWEINCSPWFVFGGTVPANVKSYTVFALSPSTGTTPIFTPVEIIIDRKTYSHKREFLFKNKKGVYEFVRFTGYFGRAKSYEAITYDRAGAHLNPFELSKFGKFAVDPRLQIEGNTGPINDGKLLWIREFFESPDIYENIGGRLYSCRLVSDTHDSFRDLVFSRGVPFTYLRAEEPLLTQGARCGGSDPEDIINGTIKPIEDLVTE